MSCIYCIHPVSLLAVLRRLLVVQYKSAGLLLGQLTCTHLVVNKVSTVITTEALSCASFCADAMHKYKQVREAARWHLHCSMICGRLLHSWRGSPHSYTAFFLLFNQSDTFAKGCLPCSFAHALCRLKSHLHQLGHCVPLVEHYCLVAGHQAKAASVHTDRCHFTCLLYAEMVVAPEPRCC